MSDSAFTVIYSDPQGGGFNATTLFGHRVEVERRIAVSLPPFRRAADAIEESGLEYTILRPAWLTDKNEVAYETTERNEPFRGTEVSRKSVAALIVKIIESQKSFVGSNLGVDKPNTDGDKPAFL